VLYLQYGYQDAFAVLVFPALISIALVVSAMFVFPRPRDFELTPPALATVGITRPYWLYLAGVALVGAGYADFALISYHFGRASVVAAPVIPLLYAVAMASSGATALILGRLFDSYGMIVVVAATSAAAIASPLVFLGGAPEVIVGIVLWGIGMATQESIMRAVIAGMSSPDRRATAFGILNAVFGVAWFVGSVLLGVVYDWSVANAAILSLLLQISAIPILLALISKDKDTTNATG
jgi:predicted MFS family arabinose efflux permease